MVYVADCCRDRVQLGKFALPRDENLPRLMKSGQYARENRSESIESLG